MHSEQVAESPQDAVRYGYSLQNDLHIQPRFDERGRVCNPDVIFRPNSLCSMCAAVAREICSPSPHSTGARRTSYYNSEADLRESVLQGCHLCSLVYLRRRSTATEKQAACDSPHWSRVAISDSGTDTLGNYLEYTGRIFPSGSFKLAIFRGIGLGYLEQKDIAARFSASNASEATFAVASFWLDKCLSKHKKCRGIQESINHWPSRLVDIGSRDGSPLRLVYPQSPARYITVSHCWGNSRSFTLTQANHDMLTEGFSETDLPQLFMDCVVVARRLGVTLMWIDSLCIMQDSTADWTYEASRMGYIYRGSLLNIAAVSAMDSTSSLFRKWHPLFTNSCYLQVNSTHAQDSIRIPIWHEDENVLYSRAWVLQERLLAVRTLEYTKDGIRWGCAETLYKKPAWRKDLADRRSHFRNSMKRSWIALSIPWDYLLDLDAAKLTAGSRKNGQDQWMRIVAAYACADLTYETDRPLALKGIISIIEKETGLNFIAGVCKEFLPYSLLWSVGGTSQAGLRDSTLTPPSWSCTYRKSEKGCPFQSVWQTSTFPQCAQLELCSSSLLLKLTARSFGPVAISLPGGQLISSSHGVAAYVAISSRCSLFTSIHMRGSYSNLGAGASLQLVMDYDIVEPLESHLVLLALDIGGEGLGLVLTRLGPDADAWERIGVFTAFGVGLEPLEEGKRSWFDCEREYTVR